MPGDKKFELGDYVEVKDRIAIFYELYPQGRLCTVHVEMLTAPDNVQRVMVTAEAYRTPDDPHPGVGTSWLLIPGSTPYTRGSEVENAETSAWGRAIASLGILINRSIASNQEVQNKQDEDGGQTAGRQAPPRLGPRTDPAAADPPAKAGPGVEELIGRVSRRGTIRKGTSKDYQLEARQGPDGHVIGFRLEVGAEKHIPQCLVTGPIGEALFLATAGHPETLVGTSATVAGILYYVKNDKGSWYRLHVDRFENADYVIPAEEALALPEPPEDLRLVGETA